MATKPLPKPQYCRCCGHGEPHHRATVWLIGFHQRPIRRYPFCANNVDLPRVWRARADPGALPGVKCSLMLVRSTNGYRGGARMLYYGYQNPEVTERISEMLELARFRG